MTEARAPHARTARDVARKGPNAVLHEDVPACWLPYLEDGNPEGLDDDDPWNAAACYTWAEQRTAEDYIYSSRAPYAGAPSGETSAASAATSPASAWSTRTSSTRTPTRTSSRSAEPTRCPPSTSCAGTSTASSGCRPTSNRASPIRMSRRTTRAMPRPRR